MAFSKFASNLILFALTACAEGGAPGGLYRLDGAAQTSCPRPVRILSTPPPEAYEALASVSATCPYTSPNTCDRRLLARGCDLAADAILLRGSHAIGRKAKPQLAEEALAIRFVVSTPVP